MSIVVLNQKPSKIKKKDVATPVKTPKTRENKTRVTINKAFEDYKEDLLLLTEQVKLMTPVQTAEAIKSFQRKWEFIIDERSKKIAEAWVAAIDVGNYEKTMAMLRKSLGVDITGILEDPEIKETLDAMRIEAANLIVTIPEKLLDDVALRIYQNYQGTPMPEDRTLQQQLREEFKISRNRARVIARDQTAKMNANLNQIRQQRIGIDVYIWRTMRDSRVVGKPGGLYPKGNEAHGNHYLMEGLYCKYSDPSVFSTDGKTWRKRTDKMSNRAPGQDIQCRCFAEPVIIYENIIDKLATR